MSTPEKRRYIEKFLKKTDKTLHEGVRKADDILDDAIHIGTITAKQAADAGKELHSMAGREKEKFREKGLASITERISSANQKTSENDAIVQLRKITELRDSGFITEDEFQAKRKDILDRI